MDWEGNINEGKNVEIAAYLKLTWTKINDKRQPDTMSNLLSNDRFG